MVQKKEWESLITKVLLEGSTNFQNLAMSLRCNRNTLRAELKRLEDNGIINKEQVGNETLYRLVDYDDHTDFKVMDLSRLIKIENELEELIAGKFDPDKRDEVGYRSDMYYLYKLEQQRPIFKVIGEPKTIENDKGETKLINDFKVNRKAQLSLARMIDLMDYCFSKSIEAIMEEVFAPSKFDTSKQATEETKRLGLSIAYKIQQRLIALEPEHDNFFYRYMYHRSSLLMNLRDWFQDTDLHPKKKRWLPDDQIEKMAHKLLKERYSEKKKKKK